MTGTNNSDLSSKLLDLKNQMNRKTAELDAVCRTLDTLHAELSKAQKVNGELVARRDSAKYGRDAELKVKMVCLLCLRFFTFVLSFLLPSLFHARYCIVLCCIGCVCVCAGLAAEGRSI